MIIEPEIKLDFKDVLIRPKRSTLTTRKEVDLSRKFSFVNAKLDIPYKGHELIADYAGIPIMASNMDGVGTMEVADSLIPHGMFTCLTKTYSENQLEKFFVTTEPAPTITLGPKVIPGVITAFAPIHTFFLIITD